MFSKQKKKADSPIRVETIIGDGTSISGNLYCKGSIRIEGKIEGGEVVVAGDVFVGKEGKILANVKGRNIVIAGEVRGEVDAKEKLEIVPTGVLIGDIKMSTLVIEDGATFKGKSESRKSLNTVTSTTNVQKLENISDKNKEKKA
ncbi:MAG: polymer-forming cytoskeletal protein [Halanaerobiales bacterium]|nr:polymer-forming cytoskeletal protein [Halanaerobiales bacterium]